MSDKHTPGPWTSNDGRLTGEGKRFICHLEGMDPRQYEDQANARLIAAAPNLLAVLRSVMSWYTDSIDEDMDPALFDRAREAITQATSK